MNESNGEVAASSQELRSVTGANARVRIVDKIRRVQKICFAAPYAQQRTCSYQKRKVYFAAMPRPEGMSRHDLISYTNTSKLEMAPIMGESGIG